MRYLMKQKLFSWSDKFRIQNEAGQDVFMVNGRALSVGHKLSFQDMAGGELAFIQQKLLAWGPTYEIYRDGALAAVVKQNMFTFARHRFMIDVPGPDDLEAVGNLANSEYTFSRGSQTVAQVSKNWFSMANTYGVDIADGQDDVLILASTVVIDRACYGTNTG